MPIVLIVVLLLLIAGFVFVYLSRETWRWYTITLTILIMISSVVWFYLAARTLRVETNWKEEIERFENRLAAVERERDEYLLGASNDENAKGISDLKVAVQKALQGRGRRWDGVERRATAQDTGVITAFVEHPEQHGIEADSILYAFDAIDAREGGQFLGEFYVSAVNGPEITLAPVAILRPAEVQRILQNSQAPLTLYEIMPTDSHAFFAELSDQEILDALPDVIPEGVRQQFIHDGQSPEGAALPDDRIWRRVRALKDFTVEAGEEGAEPIQITVGMELTLDPQTAQQRIDAGDVEPVENGNVFVRELRDYAERDRDLNREIDILTRKSRELDAELAAARESHRKLTADIAARERETAALSSDLARFRAEQKVIENHVAAIEQEIFKTYKLLRAVYLENREREAELNEASRRAAEKINRRAPPLANSGRL